MSSGISIEGATEVDLPLIEPLIRELFESMDNPPDTGLRHAVSLLADDFAIVVTSIQNLYGGEQQL